jgi:signal peptide peptidase SppA
MTSQLLTQFNYNRTKAILSTPFAYETFKSKMEKSIKDKELKKEDAFPGNTIVLTPDKPYAQVGDIAILSFSGFTVNDCSEMDEQFFGCISLQGFCDDLEQAVSDDEINTVVIDFDSGGGYTMYGDETAELVKSLSALKPIYAYTSGLMCSLAYKVACNCTKLIASPTALVGSIGVYCEYFDVSEALAKDGIKVTTFQGGSEKTVGSPYIPLTAEQSKAIQADIDNEWNSFKSLVIANRGNVNDAYMQGQAFTGKEAMTLNTNLIDGNVNSLKQFVSLISAATK